jgi:hypothetical protein
MYSSMVSPQQRLAMMEQQYQQQFPQVPQGFPQQQPQQTAPILKGRPVSSYEEANAAMIDLDGSTFYFIDQAHKAIYTKQIGLDGTATLNTYTLSEGKPVQGQVSPSVSEPMVTQSEFNQAIGLLQGQINTLHGQLMGGITNAQPNANDGTNGKRKKPNANDDATV